MQGRRSSAFPILLAAPAAIAFIEIHSHQMPAMDAHAANREKISENRQKPAHFEK